MEVYVLDKNLDTIAIIDSYTSLIWTTRYYDFGDFELYMPLDSESLTIVQSGYYLRRDDNDRIMIIEKIQITTDIENGNFLTVTGRSAESILNRRIVWTQTNLSGTAEACIYRLVNENIISPSISNRKISNFKLGTSNGFSETLSMQVTGDKLDEVIKTICLQNNWGWKITLDANKNFVFSIYAGADNGVIFSSEFDNLITSDYQYDAMNEANVAVVAGEGEGTARTRTIVGSASGIDRREIYVDSQDTSSNDGKISNSEYLTLLAQQGYNSLAEYRVTESFECEVEPNTTYSYKTDYDIGDVVTVENEYSLSAESRIIEIIESEDESGYKVIPTFEDWSV